MPQDVKLSRGCIVAFFIFSFIGFVLLIAAAILPPILDLGKMVRRYGREGAMVELQRVLAEQTHREQWERSQQNNSDEHNGALGMGFDMLGIW